MISALARATSCRHLAISGPLRVVGVLDGDDVGRIDPGLTQRLPKGLAAPFSWLAAGVGRGLVDQRPKAGLNLERQGFGIANAHCSFALVIFQPRCCASSRAARTRMSEQTRSAVSR